MQQQITMDIINRILIINERSQLAYNEYLKDKLYFQAKRIYNSNIQLLDLLNEFQFSCSKDIKEDLFKCIFHLEDWFLQFHKLEQNIININDLFVFPRLNSSFEYPKNFYNQLKKNKL